MALPTSGQISFFDLQSEFGGTDPIGIDEYYRGGGLVPANAAQGTGSFKVQNGSSPVSIATSGAIALSMFYGTSSTPPAYTYTEVVTGIVTNYNLRDRAMSLLYGSNIANGTVWDGVLPLLATVTIINGAQVQGNSSTTPAFTTGTGPYPAGSVVQLINNGSILGNGGEGGDGGSTGSGLNGEAGGTALHVTTQIYVANYANIFGGGGGGGGGGWAYDGSTTMGGGGGGAGVPNGTGGAAGNPPFGTPTYPGVAGGNSSGLPAFGGAGGNGGAGYYGGNGGQGGGYGEAGSAASGANGTTATGLPGAGGAAGFSILGESNIIWQNIGSIRGPGFVTPWTLSAVPTAANETTANTVVWTLSSPRFSPPAITSLSFMIAGATGADVTAGSVGGAFTWIPGGTSAAVLHTIVADGATEGLETWTMALDTGVLNAGEFGAAPAIVPSTSITVADTSLNPYPTLLDNLIGSGGGGGGGVTYTFQPDGQVRYVTRRPVQTQFSDWVTPSGGTPGASHWIRATASNEISTGSGSYSGVFGTWLSLSANQIWAVDASASGDYEEVDFRFEIATDSSGTNIVHDQTVTLTAENF